MHIFSCLLLTLLFLLPGCEQGTQPSPTAPTPAESKSAVAPPAPPASGTGLFNQPMSPQLLELPNEALAYWHPETEEKPALVLFSFDPMLKQIDATLQERARELALSGNQQQLRQHGSFNTSQPLILPIQTVAAALDAGLFSKIYWIFPSKVQPEQLELAKFRTQMEERKILTEEEIASINLNNGIYTGQVRGVPLEAVHYQKLYDVPEPFILHIDMSFFRGLYDNEIKTPLYTLLRDAVESLRQLNWQPLATTLSYSTLEGAIALDVRFVINNLAELMQNPQLLDGDMPKDWQLRSEALYAGDMYSDSKKKELAQQIVQVAPDSAAAHYDRFQALFVDKQLEPALQALQKAVDTDPGYGAAYLQLAQMAAKDGNHDKSLELLSKADQLFPEYPFIPLQKAHLLTSARRYTEAEKILASLPTEWSPLYHQDIPGIIARLRRQIVDGQP